MNLSKQQIGRCGELLVQQKLLLHGIESAQMTTHSGIDLVAYSARKREALTIQVKTNWKAKPTGGKGKLAIDWWIPEKSPADVFAFVQLERNRVWLIQSHEIPSLAQQHPRGRFHLCMYVDPAAVHRGEGKPLQDYEFEKYLLENQVHKIF
jgi:hypothetical protein